LYIKNTLLKPSSFKKNQQGGALAELEESRSFNLKRKGTLDESASDPKSKDEAHYADKCPKDQLCGKCGQRAHLDDPSKCERKATCVNCPKEERNNHNSFDRKCPTFIAQKEEMIRQEVYNITSKFYSRPSSSRRERYSEIVKKNNEISQVANVSIIS
jgi:hypothetical protein